MIPGVPFKVVTTVRHGPTVRQENRSAKTLAEAHVIVLRERAKSRTTKVEIWLCLAEYTLKGELP